MRDEEAWVIQDFLLHLYYRHGWQCSEAKLRDLLEFARRIGQTS